MVFFCEKARYWSRIVIFQPPPPCIRRPRWNIAIQFGAEKRMVGIPDSKKIEDMFSGVDRIPACDRQTDRHLATA